jgi:hypothetical protein
MVLVSLRSWQAYEAGSRRMPASTWALFRLTTGAMTMRFDTGAGRAVVRRIIEAPPNA